MKLVYQSKPKIKFQNLPLEEWKLKLSQDLKKIPGFLKAYFYGSFARKEDGPWSDVDIIIILENKKSIEINSLSDLGLNAKIDPKSESRDLYWDSIQLVSKYTNDYPELEPLIYTKSQWNKIISEPKPIGFWKDVRRDLVEID